jgi:ligand-binding sensor domain-containing protein
MRKDVWTVDRGLPHNTVLSLAQTRDGYLWIGTWEGLVRFDGARFAAVPASAHPTLRGSGVLSLAAAPDGSLWIGTHGGGIFQHRQGRYIVHSDPGIDLREHVVSLLVTRAGPVYAGTSSGSVLRLDAAGPRALELASGPARVNIYSLAEDREGRVLAATDGGLLLLEGARLRALSPDWPGEGVPLVSRLAARAAGGWWLATSQGLMRLDPDLSQVHAGGFDSALTRLLEDRDGSLWLGAEPLGLVHLHAGRREVLGRAEGLPNSRIASLLRDHEGNLWIGSNGGLVRLHAAAFGAVTEHQGLADPFVRTLLPLADGSLLAGGPAGIDLLTEGRVQRRPGWLAPLGQQSVLSLARGQQGLVAIGTSADGAWEWDGAEMRRRRAPTDLGSAQVRAILVDDDASVWYGTTLGLSHCAGPACRSYRRGDGLEGDFVTALMRDRTGTLWIGTSMGATRLESQVIQAAPFADGTARSVFGFLHDRQGRLWVCSDGGIGLWRNGHFDMLDRRHGLLDDAVFALVEDADGHFWLSGNRGLLRLAPKELLDVLDGRRPRIAGRQFGRADGLPSNQMNGGSQPSAVSDASGRLWFATAGGVGFVDPDSPMIDAPAPPPRATIEAVLIDGVETETAEQVTLGADQRRLQLRFGGISFAAPGRIQLRYRLRGFDGQWQVADSERSAGYTNLAPGIYRFEVEAGWPDAPTAGSRAELRVQVLPAWHQRTDVRIGGGIMLALLTALALHWRVRALRLRAASLEQEVERQTRDLIAERDALAQANRRNAELAEQLGRQAREDPLTGLANRRHADRILRETLAAGPATLALLDIDHFKTINDRHGHAFGDQVLSAFAHALRECAGCDPCGACRWRRVPAALAR